MKTIVKEGEGNSRPRSIAPERKGERVHAIAAMGGWWTIVENVAEVGVAPRTEHFHPDHAVAQVVRGADIQVRDWGEKAGPPCTRIKFCV